MILPAGAGGGDGGGEGPSRGAGGRARRLQAKQRVVQWRQQNVQHGLVIVDETQLAKLIKRQPIDQFYHLDPAPFATGMFASVRRCRSKETGMVFAAKFCSRNRYGEDCSAEIYHELTLLSLLSPSPRIIKLHDVFETPTEVIIVCEYAPGGDLQTIIDENMVPFESDVQHFVRQLVEGLAYIHDRKIVHLDIKPQNIVMMGPFPECDIKLCDFEISRVLLEGVEVREILGTPDYVAPEIIQYEPLTFGADMWSLGVTVYVLLTGFSPFGGETDQETFANISRCDLDFPEELFEDVSAEAQDFVARLLIRDPSKRMTAKECLRHPWLAKKSRGGNSKSSLLESPQLSGGKGSQKNLRKFMSKSREALFERVSGNRALSKSRERLCESQFSLVSKSREKLLMLEPSARSIEKLYGLRSLSKSQDALSARELFALSPALASQHRLRYQSECFAPPDVTVRFNPKPEPVPATPEITVTEPQETLVKTACIAPKKVSAPSSTSGQNGDAPELDEEDNKENQMAQPVLTPTPVIETPQEPVEETAPRSGRKSRSPTTSDEEEPRYSVAQLVTAFNKNDQMATNSAKAYDKSVPSKLKFVNSFPTGPNALRLFIPDIMISDTKRKRSPVTSTVSGCTLDTLAEVRESSTTSPDQDASSMAKGLDDRNNNSGNYGHLLKVSEDTCRGNKDTNRPFNRSSSLSSEASGYDTLSAASSIVSLEEASPPTSLNPATTSPPPSEDPKKKEDESAKSSPEPPRPRQRQRSSSLQVDSLRPLWGSVCVGSYNRAMERFNNKTGSGDQQNGERQRRKSSPLIKTPRN